MTDWGVAALLLALAGFGGLAGLSGYVIWRLDESRRELVRQVITLAASRNASDYTIARASQEGRLSPRPATDNPMQDDEWEALIAERRKARDQALLDEWMGS